MFNPFLIFQRELHIKMNRILRNQEIIMSQVDDLKAALTAISNEIDKISGETTELVQKLNDANQNPAVDLSDVIEQAKGIANKLQAVDDLVPDAPVTEPTEPETTSTTDTPAVS
jgi:uncharacterized protein YoxC